MTGLETGGIAIAIITALSASAMAFIKMLSDRNAVIESPCCGCKLDLRSKEVRLKELEILAGGNENKK